MSVHREGDLLSQHHAEQDDQVMQMVYTMMYVSFTGFVMSTLYFIFNYVYTEIMRKTTCRITIHGNDAAYRLVIDFLKDKGFLQASMNQLKCQIKKKGHVYWWMRSRSETDKPDIEFLPGPGNHFFQYQGKKMWAQSSEGETLMTGWEKKPTKQETLTIVCTGQDTTFLKNLV